MFDFDTPIDRKSSDSFKWQKYSGTDIIPMWVADMDFASPPAVLDALHQRVAHGIFGYAQTAPKLLETIMDHLDRCYQWQVAPEWIVGLPGLVTGLNVVCRSAGRPGAGVLTMVPIYPPFLSAPALAGKKRRTVPLHYVDTQWRFDADEIQHAIDPRTALFLLCNPQNPTGRVFTRKELETLAEICLRAKVVICSDEIHCDLVLEPGCKHIPMASLSPQIAEHTITLMAPSKTYNIPGLGCAFAVIANPRLRARFQRAMEGIVPHTNVLGMTAAQAAYEHGREWLEELLDYLRINRDLVQAAIAEMQGMHMAPVEATYLAWIDTRDTGIKNPVSFFEHGGVGLFDGAAFGAKGFVRLNFGCPRSLLTTALERMAQALKQR
jgi:cystathionine beta-lyase